MGKLKKSSKFTNEQFFSCLRENGGIYARTARKLEELYGIDITRQGVKDRADKHPEIMADIKDELIDIAEDSIVGLMRQTKDRRIQLDATKTFLKAMARHRGWGEKHELLVRQMTVLSTEERTDRRLALEEKMKANKRIDI